MSAGSPPAVVVDGVSKTFRIPKEHRHTLKERALHPFKRSGFREFRALRDVSFEIERGEFFGIVGRNGSGKSTLLKCLAGIYRHDSGRIAVEGRLSTFIELGVGFNPDLAARDNVVINAVMLGLNPAEARERFDRILDFSELHDFVDLKLKNYSSGMQVRLAFATAVEVDADVMLVDEVLAVGDASFQQKCFDVFDRLRDEGRTIVFVTHDMGSVERFCDRAVLLEQGEIVTMGEPSEVANRYLELNFQREAAGHPSTTAAWTEQDRQGDGRAEIVDAWFEDDRGERVQTVRVRERCHFRARVRFHAEVTDPILGVNFDDSERHHLFATNSTLGDEPTGTFRPGDEVEYAVHFENLFAPGRITATPAVATKGAGVQWLDRRERLVAFRSVGAQTFGTLVQLHHDFRFERVGAADADAASPLAAS